MRRGLLGALSSFASFAFVLASSVAGAQPQPQDIGTGPPPGQTIVVQPPASAQPAAPSAPQPAQTPPPAPAKKKKPAEEKEWYGWQTLGVDAGAAALMIAGQATQAYSVFDVGFGAYIFGPPVVHIVHGNAGPAFGSVGLRLASPWVCAAIGIVAGAFFLGSTSKDVTTGHYATSHILLFKDETWATPIAVGFNVGLVGGYLLALGIDAFLIAYEKVDDTEYGRLDLPKPPPRHFSVAPKLAASPRGGTLGLGGTF